MKLKDISSSQLRHIIDIIGHTSEVDSDGIPVDVEDVVATVRARVDVPSLRRQETLVAQGINVSKSLMFVFRYIEGFDSEVHKIRFKNKVYEIAGVENVEEKDLFFNVLGEIKS